MTNSNNKTQKSKSELFLRIAAVAIICIALTVVSFMAFIKIENNLQAFSVFAIGMLVNCVLCYGGLNQKLY